jgi:glyoxylase-like metal-dependent hydrolase (beta-lactamase superfamily II)
MAATTLAAGGWLTQRQAFAEARNLVDLIRDDAAKAPIKVHKLRDNVSILEGSGGNIAVLTGADGKVFVDAGITASRPRILEAADSLSRDPIKHLINTHWHFDHTDGNEWLNAEGAAIIAHENTHKHLLVAQRVEDWDFNFPSSPLPAVPTETFSSEKTMKLNGSTLISNITVPRTRTAIFPSRCLKRTFSIAPIPTGTASIRLSTTRPAEISTG